MKSLAEMLGQLMDDDFGTHSFTVPREYKEVDLLKTKPVTPGKKEVEKLKEPIPPVKGYKVKKEE